MKAEHAVADKSQGLNLEYLDLATKSKSGFQVLCLCATEWTPLSALVFGVNMNAH